MSTQASLGLALIKCGALQLTAGFIWGTLIPLPPYPRIALSAHLNIIQHGLLSIAAGLIARDGAAQLSDWQIQLVAWAHFGLWALDIIGAANSWWGTNKAFTILAKEAEAKGGTEWQETVVGGSRVFAAVLIPAWAVLTYELL